MAGQPELEKDSWAFTYMHGHWRTCVGTGTHASVWDCLTQLPAALTSLHDGLYP